MKRVRRLLRADNLAAVNGYGDALAMIFRDWVKNASVRGAGSHLLVGRLQSAAEDTVPAAYLRGKRQAFPGTSLTSADRNAINGLLSENERYLSNSLASAVSGKIMRQQLQPTDPDFVPTLERAFTARVKNGYGGMLWRATEQGFLAGYRELKQALQYRAQAGLAMEPELIQAVGDAELAAALNMNEGQFITMLGAGVSALRLGIQRNCLDDERSCSECPELEGVYEEEEDVPVPGEQICQDNCRCDLETVILNIAA